MSTTRIVFIIVSVVLAALVFTLGIIYQKNGNGGISSVSSLLNRNLRAEKKNRTVSARNMSSYFTIVLLAAVVVMIIVLSRK